MVTSVVQFSFDAVASATRFTHHKSRPHAARSQRRAYALNAPLSRALCVEQMASSPTWLPSWRRGSVISGDALRRCAPAFQRGPQAAIQAEAVDRRRARDRADALQTRAGPLK